MTGFTFLLRENIVFETHRKNWLMQCTKRVSYLRAAFESAA